MKASKLTVILGLTLAIVSCQKEITDGTPQPGGGTGGNTNGNLLVKGIQITPATNDTNIVTAQWDASNRLIVYKTNGVVNGFPTLFTSTITRAADGRITKIFSKTDLVGTLVDSISYTPTYEGTSNKLKYVYSIQNTFLGEISDSTVFTYNAGGLVTAKESFQNFWGPMEPVGKETYEYDANGNVTKISRFEFDGVSYSLSSTQTITYVAHKSPVTLGEEAYITLGAINTAKNNIGQIVVNNIAASQTNTVVYSEAEYNSFDRPIKGKISVNPIPPGYVNNVTYFYQ